MNNQKRIRDYGVRIGALPTGPLNAITDVAGVLVGHATISEGAVRTGVTAVLPHNGNLFRDKVMAACHVINGFGKTAGTIQIEELGTIETPLILTNTLSVGIAFDAVVQHMLAANADIGITAGTVSPLIAECNDGFLNDIRGGHVQHRHIHEAIAAASGQFAEGAAGAGTGMSCYGLKGGIGSASRQFPLDGKLYTLGALVLANFGLIEDLTVAGRNIGPGIQAIEAAKTRQKEQGSIIVILATDAPANERQLKRLCRRAVAGIARTGSFIANGSGDVVIAFTTANRVSHDEKRAIVPQAMLTDSQINPVFRAVADSTEEAILNALITAEAITGRDGNERRCLAEYQHLLVDPTSECADC